MRVHFWLQEKVQAKLDDDLLAIKPIRKSIFGEILSDMPDMKSTDGNDDVPDFTFCFSRAKVGGGGGEGGGGVARGAWV